MAEGGDRAEDFETIQLPDTTCTKQEAINTMERIISHADDKDTERIKEQKQFLKTLEESVAKPDEPLGAKERELFFQMAGEQVKAKHNQLQIVSAEFLEIHQRGQSLYGVNQANKIFAMEEKLRATRDRLQETLDRQNTLQQEFTQYKTQQAQERIVSENDRAAMRNQMSTERQQFERELTVLRDIIYKLNTEKHELKQQIDELRTKLEEEKAMNEKFKQDQDEKLQRMSQNSMKEIGELRYNMEKLMQENKNLKIPEPYKLVSHCVTLMTNALYQYVHQTKLKKNYYSIEDLDNHLRTKYKGKEDEQRAAEERWKEIKTEIGWKHGTESVLQQLAANRGRGRSEVNFSGEYHEFSEAVRIMFNDNEIDEDEMELLRDLYTKCKHNDNLLGKP